MNVLTQSPQSRFTGGSIAVLLMIVVAILVFQARPVDMSPAPDLGVQIPQWDQIDPVHHPGLFDGGPGAMIGDQIVMDKFNGYTYRMNEEGLVLGQTRFGYAFFASLRDYETFVLKYP